jgi:hypothetical protein
MSHKFAEFDKLEPKKPYLLTEYKNGVSILANDNTQFIVLKGAKKQNGKEWKNVK